MKTEWTKCLERSWKAPDKFVCPDCVEDAFLRDEIVRNRTKRTCDYCGKGSRGYIAAPVHVIMQPIAAALFHRFDDWPNAGLPDEGNLDELLTELPPTLDALREIPLKCHNALLEDAAAAFWCDRWVKKWGSFHDYDRSMSVSWRNLVQTVKHRERFFFSAIKRISRRDFSFVKSPAELLKEIGQIVSKLKLVTLLRVESELFRVRLRPKGEDWCLDEQNLGAPPNEKVLSSQRMNPAGISYLYLAKERATAIAEVLGNPPCQAALGCFKVRRDIRVLDLVSLPMPSPFDITRQREEESISFLRDFAEEISKPVQKDGTEHIEYVPSQVVCEYFAKVFWADDGKLDGLAYRSAVRPGGTNIVLFPPQRRGDRFSDLVSLSRAEELAITGNPQETFSI